VTINRRNVVIGSLIIVVIVLMATSDDGGAKTADPGKFQACLDREVGTRSPVNGISGEPKPSHTQASFALTGLKTSNPPRKPRAPVVDVFVFKDSAALGDALDHGPNVGYEVNNEAKSVVFRENVMWLTVRGGGYGPAIRNCIGEAS
jgi:hypothetical protein